MANYETLKASIVNYIKENDNAEITGPILQAALLAMINSLGAGYQYAGVASLDTNPGVPDRNVYYFAFTQGVYPNFSAIELLYGEQAILRYDGEWHKDLIATHLGPFEKGSGTDSAVLKNSWAKNEAGTNAMAVGYGTKATGDQAFAEGFETVASGKDAHAEGHQTTASNHGSHAEGSQVTASGENAHAEGSGGEASGFASHKEGFQGLAIGPHSHVEGFQTKATREDAHAEGHLTQANEHAAHSEGHETQANGWASHSEGVGTKADGHMSHAEGAHTRAVNDSEHACGRYNVSRTGDAEAQRTIWTVGGGTSETDRKNFAEIRGDGKMYLYGLDEPVQDILLRLLALLE